MSKMKEKVTLFLLKPDVIKWALASGWFYLPSVGGGLGVQGQKEKGQQLYAVRNQWHKIIVCLW